MRQKAEERYLYNLLHENVWDGTTPLLADLKEYGRKHIWQFQQEPKYLWEQASWIRAVAFFAGEAEKEADDNIYRLRHQALTEYRTRPVPSPNGKGEAG